MDRRDVLKTGASAGALGFIDPGVLRAAHKRSRSLSTIPTLLGAGGHGAGGQNFQVGTTYYANVGLGRSPMLSGPFTTESYVSQIIRVAGTISYLSWAVDTAFGATLTLALNKNSSNTALTVSIGPSVTGWVTDSTHSVSVSNGDALDFAVNTSANESYLGNFYCVSARFDADTGSAQLLATVGPAPIGPTTSQKFLNFLGIVGGGLAIQTESNEQFRSLAAGTWQNMACSLESNSFNKTTTFTSRKNGSNGAMSLSVAGSTSGYSEDLISNAHDSVSVGDLIDYGLVASAAGNGNTFQMAWIGAHFHATSTNFCMIGGCPSGPSLIPSPLSPGESTYYNSLFGGGNIAPTDISRSTGLFPYDLSAGQYTNYITAASQPPNGGAATFTLLKNGSASGLAASSSPGQTGYITDPGTHSVSFAVGDTCANMIALTSDLSTTNITWGGAALLLQATG